MIMRKTALILVLALLLLLPLTQIHAAKQYRVRFTGQYNVVSDKDVQKLKDEIKQNNPGVCWIRIDEHKLKNLYEVTFSYPEDPSRIFAVPGGRGNRPENASTRPGVTVAQADSDSTGSDNQAKPDESKDPDCPKCKPQPKPRPPHIPYVPAPKPEDKDCKHKRYEHKKCRPEKDKAEHQPVIKSDKKSVKTRSICKHDRPSRHDSKPFCGKPGSVKNGVKNGDKKGTCSKPGRTGKTGHAQGHGNGPGGNGPAGRGPGHPGGVCGGGNHAGGHGR